MIKVRLSPLIKALGFRHNERNFFYLKHGDKVCFEGRVYKKTDGKRYLNVFEHHYDFFGEFSHYSVVCYGLCLDVDYNELGSIVIWISYLANEIGNFPYVMKNINYWLGLDQNKYE